MRSPEHLIIPLLLAPLLSGCVGDKAEYVHSVWRGPDAAEVERRVFFVTDRAPDKDWPGGFGKHWADRPSCGEAVVRIPAAGLPDQPIPNGRLASANPAACDTFADRLAAEARARNCGTVLLYIHGFNTLFDGGALRAGQLVLDTRWDCPALVFSWSSEGEIGRYVADIEHSAYAVPEVAGVVERLSAHGIALDIVAHSIGARVALSALSAMARHGRTGTVNELILAAPDVGADPANDDFSHLVADARPLAHRITVYASAQDAVLAVSSVAHGNVPRAGHRPRGDRALEDAAVDVVDASEAPAELLGHSYFGLSQEAVSDMALVLRGVPIAGRLTQSDGWPLTLVRVPDDRTGPHYMLNVAAGRRPGFWTRLVRKLAPLIPRLELAPLTGSPE